MHDIGHVNEIPTMNNWLKEKKGEDIWSLFWWKYEIHSSLQKQY